VQVGLPGEHMAGRADLWLDVIADRTGDEDVAAGDDRRGSIHAGEVPGCLREDGE
jgi:hypothetical protein